MPSRALTISDTIEIPNADLRWSYARAGGAGGQHVNTTDTRARLHFALTTCRVLNGGVKQRLRQAHPGWCTSDGNIVLSGDGNRSRHRNIDDVRRRLTDAIRAVLQPPRRRRPTRPSRSQVRKRLDSKKARGKVKANRRKPSED
jgi:ribosome-associated protein